MDASTIGLANSVVSVIFWLGNVALLVWVLMQARSSAKKLTVIGMAIGLTAILVGFLSGLLHQAFGMSALIITTVIVGGIGLAANILRTKAFLDADKVAAKTEGGFQEGVWRSDQQPGPGGANPALQTPGQSQPGYGQSAAGYGNQPGGYGTPGGYGLQPTNQPPGRPPAGWNRPQGTN